MTTIAYKDGILAADSRETSGDDDDSGQLAAQCEKLFRVADCVVALQGDTTAGMVWLTWFRSVHETAAVLHHVPDDLVERFLEHEADFTAVVLTPSGALYIYDEWGLPQRITAPYYAVGSGAKVAYGAMHAGAGAVAAVEAACAHDPYTSLPVHSSEII